MAVAIITGLTTPGTAATGRSTQGHIQYAVNQGAWWVFYLTSTNQLSAKYSTDGTTWTAPTGSPFTLTKVHNSEGRNYGFAYLNKASTDVLHMVAGSHTGTGTLFSYASRFTLGPTWSNTNAEADIDQNNVDSGTAVSGLVTGLDSTSLPFSLGSYLNNGNMHADRAATANTDAGTSWAGYGVFTIATIFTPANYNQSNAIFPLATASTMLAIGDNGSGATTFTQLEWSKYSAGWGAAATVLATTVTGTDPNNWGACALSSSDIHVVALSNNINIFVHRRFNGTSWANGNTPNNLAYGTTSGIAVVSDGTSVWAFAADTSKNIQYSKWTSGGGWGAWTVLEATRTNAPRYLSACMKSDNSAIQLIWTETNGSNFEVWTSNLSLSAAPSFLLPNPFPSIPYAFLSY